MATSTLSPSCYVSQSYDNPGVLVFQFYGFDEMYLILFYSITLYSVYTYYSFNKSDVSFIVGL